ncbi:hypothetical protein GCM10022291_12240 [Postechiella marina]|uniref:Glycosyltransferase n=2 Tax=Postechiella marina TaxID=943941 RepID=A0ABP8C5N9_9FLAO
MTQKEVGMDVVAITAPFQAATSNFDIIDGIKYYRSKFNEKDTISDKRKSLGSRILRLFSIFSFYNEIKKIIIIEKPNVLHAHAMFFCGIPALLLAKKYKVPFVYEVRSLWMLKKEKKKTSKISDLIERLLFKTECFVMKKANQVVVINENLKQVIVNSGVPSDKIVLINNAVNTTLINKLKDIDAVKERDEVRFGYIGTLTPHEGIDMLIEAFNIFNLKHPKSRLIIFGCGIEEERISQLAQGNNKIDFKGKIDPNEVYKAFNAIDIIVNPRYKNKLTDSVTPLKPLEAMAYSKLVIGSDVGGIKELVKHEKNGFLFSSGSVKELVKTMEYVVNLDLKRVKEVKVGALNYVQNQKSWLNNASIYHKNYQNLINE